MTHVIQHLGKNNTIYFMLNFTISNNQRLKEHCSAVAVQAIGCLCGYNNIRTIQFQSK